MVWAMEYDPLSPLPITKATWSLHIAAALIILKVTFPIIEVVKMTTMTPLKFHCVVIVEIKSSQDGSLEFQPFNASSISKQMLLLLVPHTQRSIGLESLDHTGDMARRRTTDKMLGHSLVA